MNEKLIVTESNHVGEKKFIFEFKTMEKTHKYKSGAVYEGSWLGGFRHGHGTMKWPDGATYTGTWSFNEPSQHG